LIVYNANFEKILFRLGLQLWFLISIG